MNSNKVHVLIQISLLIILIRLGGLLLSSLWCSVPFLLFSVCENVSIRESGSSESFYGRAILIELIE